MNRPAKELGGILDGPVVVVASYFERTSAATTAAAWRRDAAKPRIRSAASRAVAEPIGGADALNPPR